MLQRVSVKVVFTLQFLFNFEFLKSNVDDSIVDIKMIVKFGLKT